jgi:hypothetical protein
MIYLRTVLFVLSGLSIHQILYTIFPFLRARYKSRFCNLVSSCSVDEIANTQSSELYNYPEIFSGNYYKNGAWVFNSASFVVDDDFLFSLADKWDYTPRVHFQHMEWLFCTDRPVDEYLRLSPVLSRSTFYWHPSPATQRFFVLLYLYLDGRRAELIPHIKDHAVYIAENIEINLHGNHFLDNLLAMLAYSALTKDRELYVFIHHEIYKNFLNRFDFFPEKTPCYCALLNARLQLLSKLDVPFSGFDQLCRSIEKLLLNNPPVHLNDSYLVFNNWFRIYSGPRIYSGTRISEGYFATLCTDSYVYTLVGKSFGLRGFQAHSHDSSGSLFVHDAQGRQIIGGLGTKYYAAGEIRNRVRSSDAYCKVPGGESKFKIRHFFGSFRNFGFNTNRYAVQSERDSIALLVNGDQLVSISNNSILFENGGNLAFWSDLSPELLEKTSTFENIDILNVEKSIRYDGIYNEVECYYYSCLVYFGSGSIAFKRV